MSMLKHWAPKKWPMCLQYHRNAVWHYIYASNFISCFVLHGDLKIATKQVLD